MCRFPMLVSLCLVGVTAATDEPHGTNHDVAFEYWPRKPMSQRIKYGLDDKTQAVKMETRGASFPQYGRRWHELSQSEQSVPRTNNGRMKIRTGMRACYERCGDDHGCFHQCNRQWKVMKAPQEGALADTRGPLKLQLGANGRNCRHECGDDRACLEECMKPYDIMSKKCDEFENVRACHEACADDFRCHKRCPTLHRAAHSGQGAADCHARCGAGKAGRECYSQCSKPTENFQQKCVALAEARACHGKCHREDHACQKSCWHKTHGEDRGGKEDHYDYDDADTHHGYTYHRNDLHGHFVDDETDISYPRHSHGHHRGFSSFWHHMKERIADGVHTAGHLWHFATTKARHGIGSIWHNVSQKVAGLWQREHGARYWYHGWRMAEKVVSKKAGAEVHV